METPYPSQLALPSSNSSTSPSTSASTSNCLSTGTSSSTSTAEEPRRTHKRTASDCEEDCSNGSGSQMKDELASDGLEQGSLARPRTILRRSRTTHETEKSRGGAERIRRASSISLRGEEESRWIEARRGQVEEGPLETQEELTLEQWSTLQSGEIGGERLSPESSRVEVIHSNPISSKTLPFTSSVTRLPTEPTLPQSEPLNRSASLPSLSSCPTTAASSSPAQIAPPQSHLSPLSTSSSPPTKSVPFFSTSTPASIPCPSRHRRSRSLPTLFSFAKRASHSPSPTIGSCTPFRPPQRRPTQSRAALNDRSTRDPVIPPLRTSTAETIPGPRIPSRQALSPSDIVDLHAEILGRNGNDSPSHLVTASLSPPISRNTLRELDLQEVMRNAQLRHDVVFDPNLMFRPNFDGERGERKRILAEQYWTAVSREIFDGCRCTTFLHHELLPCICMRNPSSSSRLFVSASRLPTRITPLVAELRGILLSLLPATNPSSPTPPSTAVFGSTSDPYTPSPIYGPREQLIDTLDPSSITQQLANGVLDVAGLARFLGATLKTHCAPMRDDLVDEMIAVSEEKDGIVTGLRMCFEILELMKLDVANHQLRSLRPYLLQTSVEFERRFFDNLYATGTAPLTVPRSRAWIKTAVESLDLKEDDLPKVSKALVNRTVAHGVLDLVFAPPTPVAPSAPSPSQSSLSTLSALPETLQLDSYRLAHFHCDVTDLTIVYMLTLLYQQLASPARPSTSDVDLVRHELWCLIASNMGSLPSLVDSPASVVGIPSGPAGPGVDKLENESWRFAMQDAIFQVAARAQQAKLGHSSILVAPDASLVSLVQGYFDANARPGSKVFKLLSNRLRQTLQVYVEEELAREKEKSDFDFLNWWTVPAGGFTMRTGHRRMPARAGAAGGERIGSFTLQSDVMASSSPSRGFKRSHSEDNDTSEELDDEGEKRQRIGHSSSISISIRSVHSPSNFDAILSRNGLTSLRTEIKVLGDRITKVTSYNLSVFRPLYDSLLSV
ncbi:hypothetical protein JCM3765_005480 [Sporobolomyces pararoseus]